MCSCIAFLGSQTCLLLNGYKAFTIVSSIIHDWPTLKKHLCLCCDKYSYALFSFDFFLPETQDQTPLIPDRVVAFVYIPFVLPTPDSFCKTVEDIFRRPDINGLSAQKQVVPRWSTMLLEINTFLSALRRVSVLPARGSRSPPGSASSFLAGVELCVSTPATPSEQGRGRRSY